MKKKYFALIGILLLILVISASVIIVKKNKMEEDEAEQEESVYITEEKRKKIEEKKEELIRLCEENQEELEAMSKEYLALIEESGKTKEELTYEDIIEMYKQIKGDDFDFPNKMMYIPNYAMDFEGIVYYRCWSKWGYSLDLIYIDADVEKVLECMEEYGYYAGEIIEINEHLYVYLKVFPGT